MDSNDQSLLSLPSRGNSETALEKDYIIWSLYDFLTHTCPKLLQNYLVCQEKDHITQTQETSFDDWGLDLADKSFEMIIIRMFNEIEGKRTEIY